MSDDQPVVLEGIPVFTGDLALLDATVKELTKDGAKIATAAGDIHSSFGGLQAFYQAPEADQLFATTKPVADRGAALKSDLATITGALGTYSDEAYPLVEKLRQLKRDAGAFLVKVNADDKWREDGDLVEENNHRRDEIRETWAAFQAVERACYNKIIAMVPGGKPLTTNDGSGGKHMYGYDAEALKQAKGLPWGDPVKESTRWYQFYEHVWDFGKGFVVDGVWGTVKGLGTLFGTEGWDSMKQAWGGLADLSIGVSITLVTAGAGGTYLLTTPEEELPSWLRDSSRAMKETGKALIAYDQWSENPARAGGAVTFNALTTVFTGGAGGGVSGAGKAALAGKALSFANKASRAVDPTTYLFKGAGAGLTKISDVMAGLKGTGNIEIPPLPAGTIALPDGAYKAADGTLALPEGAAVPEAAFEIPKGSVKLPDGAEIPTGAVDLGDGIVHLPEGMAPPAGSLPIQEGTLKLPEGTTALPENAVELTTPDGKTVYVDHEGNILAADGTLKQHYTDAPKGNPPTGASTRTDADSPLPRTPAEQSALVGAGARGGSDTVRLGSDLGDTGRVGDDFGRTGDDAPNPDRAPGGTANNLPTNSADNGTRGGSRGGQGGNIPANSLDGGNPTGTGGRDAQEGSATDNGVPSPRNPGGAEGAAREVDGTPRDMDHAAPHGDQTQPGSAHQANHESPGLHGADLSENWGTHNGEPVNYATKPDEKAVAEYARIRATTEDIPRIAENYGIDPDILQRAKNNLFLEKHDAYVGPGPENFKKDVYFTAYEEISMLWKRAENGTLKDLEGAFRGLIIHEYIESRLMEAGVPYTSGHPSAWEDIRDWSNGHIGAHDIAPLSFRGAPPTARGTLVLWPKMGLDIPEFTLLPDLSNLDILADAAKKGLGIQ
ncbi:hypothetical protein ACUN3E_11150 [Streptomyces sp. Ju416(a)]|uniref:hypothetical protein n=1 Tax=unclassified Streptomyces TaxID=2593676 RepID=UPI001EF464FB|nr:hypothetical protein [Streptomyces sp. CS014]